MHKKPVYINVKRAIIATCTWCFIILFSSSELFAYRECAPTGYMPEGYHDPVRGELYTERCTYCLEEQAISIGYLAGCGGCPRDLNNGWGSRKNLYDGILGCYMSETSETMSDTTGIYETGYESCSYDAFELVNIQLNLCTELGVGSYEPGMDTLCDSCDVYYALMSDGLHYTIEYADINNYIPELIPDYICQDAINERYLAYGIRTVYSSSALLADVQPWPLGPACYICKEHLDMLIEMEGSPLFYWYPTGKNQ